MLDLPAEALSIDPDLSNVGSMEPYQRLIYGRKDLDHDRALVVAQLVSEHPLRIGVVGRFYGTVIEYVGPGRRLLTHGIGEVLWDYAVGRWVAAEEEVWAVGAA